MGQEQVRTAFSGCAVGHFTHWNVSSPNKQNPDSGIETSPWCAGPGLAAPVQTNRIPTQGLKPGARSGPSVPVGGSKQTESRLRD